MGLQHDTAEDAVVAAAEFLENVVVVHANTPFRLTARLRGPMLLITVSDGVDAETVAQPLTRAFRESGPTSQAPSTAGAA